ncbi:MAG: nucleoside-diphosphate sugar epimerase/dehydratase [Thauera sp.]|nr:nucleoside-diphosphate sugar epimerase/dehydratase [Thauera sp.]
MNLPSRQTLVFLFDLFAVGVAWWGGLLLLGAGPWIMADLDLAVGFFLVLTIAQAFLNAWAGLYRGIWVFASLPDLRRVVHAVLTASLLLAVLVFCSVWIGRAPPWEVMIQFPVILLVTMGGGRAAWRMWKEYRLYGGLVSQGRPVVVVGAGTGGAMLGRELERSPDWRVVAFLDDDRHKWGREIHGHPVLGGTADLPRVLQQLRVQHVILAMPSAQPEILSHVADLAVKAGAQVFTVPGLDDLMSGKVAVNAMRAVDIEDLLGREPVQIDSRDVGAMVRDRTVLITGAGGSIGSELCRQLAGFPVQRMVLLDASEYALYTIEQWFLDHRPEIEIVALIGDVQDADRLEEVFAAWRPELVFHAAAYKHVPLMEVGNAWQAVKNNVLGTLRTAQAALRHGVDRFVLVSTDKAVSPTNVMGASKRLAEMVCEALQNPASLDRQGTQFSVVRFGNVLGSTGSVIPKFAEQIARGGPVTVTHPEIRRYFMSIPEAAQLVLQAAAMGRGGEVFVLDMGEPVKILDLARNMIRLSGYSEDQLDIVFTGLRPGEKLFEELLADTEKTVRTAHPKLRIACSRPVLDGLVGELEAWFKSTSVLCDEDVRRALLRWVPEYTPMGTRPLLRVVEGGGDRGVEMRAPG